MLLEHGELLIRDYIDFWELHLHSNQCYLGRVYIKSKRSELVDLADTTKDEREDLFAIMNDVKGALQKLFQPDLLNWASMGNVIRQCHMHCVPRYSGPRMFDGFSFKDARWNQNWAPYDSKWRAPDNITLGIRDAIKKLVP